MVFDKSVADGAVALFFFDEDILVVVSDGAFSPTPRDARVHFLKSRPATGLFPSDVALEVGGTRWRNFLSAVQGVGAFGPEFDKFEILGGIVVEGEAP